MEFDIPSSIVISCLLSFVMFLLFVFLKSQTISKSAKAYSHFPGPKALPFIGNLHLVLGRGAAAPHHMLRDLAGRYGPLMHLQVGEIHVLIISSADLAEQVMKTHDINFANRPWGQMTKTLSYNHSDIVFAPYGDYWRHLKKICTLHLLSARRVHSLRPIRVEENINFAKCLASCQGSPVNLSERLYFLTYDITTRAVVGGKKKKNNNTERATVSSILQQATKLIPGFISAELYPSIKSLPLITGTRFKIKRMQRKLDGILDTIIDHHRSRSAVKDDDEGVSEDLLDVLLKSQADGTEMPLTDDNIKAVILDMFGAGTDSSTNVVEWAMSEMIRNPSKLNKAQEEVRKVFDDKGYVDEEMFEELKYLKLIINETLRLHPPAPLLLPKVNTERCEINGYEIPEKSRVIINAWALGRDLEYWNEPEKFEPERFEKNSINYKGNNFEYIPFGAGRRMCPGIALGLANVRFTLVMLLYHFDWKMPNGMKNEELNMTEEFGVSVNRKHHLHLIPILKRPLPANAA